MLRNISQYMQYPKKITFLKKGKNRRQVHAARTINYFNIIIIKIKKKMA